MKFNDFVPPSQVLRDECGINENAVELYADFCEHAASKDREAHGIASISIDMIKWLAVERAWKVLRRPYYAVYPDIMQALLQVSLDVRLCDLSLPVDPLVVRLADRYTLGEFPVASFLVTKRAPVLLVELLQELDPVRGKDLLPLIHSRAEVSWDIVAMLYPQSLIVDRTTSFSMSLNDGEYSTLEQEFAAMAAENDDAECCAGGWTTKAIAQPVQRLAVACCLLGEDPDLVLPDVLNKDKSKFAATGDQKYIDKAARRGKVGWTVGKAYHERADISAHYRMPHFAIRWMGHGDGKKPVLRPIKGSWVKRDKIEEIPTGYLDDE